MNRGIVATAHLTTTGAIRNGIAVDYHPTSHASRGLVYEQAGTNVIFPCAPPAASSGMWTKRAGSTFTMTAGQTGPTGEATATLVTNLGATGVNDFYSLPGGVFTAGQYIAASCCIKRVSTTGTLRFQNTYEPGNGVWSINLALLGSGWERITSDHPAVTATTPFSGYSSPAGAVGTHFYMASGTGSFYIDCIQLEAGASSAPNVPCTSIIQTFGASVTRAADNYTFLLSSIPSLGSDYSIYCRFVAPVIDSARHVFVVTDGTTNEYAGFLINNTARLAVVDGGPLWGNHGGFSDS
jgi:hypothetical protein